VLSIHESVSARDGSAAPGSANPREGVAKVSVRTPRTVARAAPTETPRELWRNTVAHSAGHHSKIISNVIAKIARDLVKDAKVLELVIFITVLWAA